MFISTAYAAGVKSILKNDASLSDYFLSQFENLTPWKIIIGLVMGCIVGLIIAFVYKRCYRGVLYSPTFAMTLMMLTLITTPVVMCIKSDIALSMGMVGALSIVRFRTAVKDPLDLLYLFWAITTGITSGAGMYLLVLVAALVMILLVAFFYSKQQKGRIYIMVVHYTGDEAGDNVIRALGKMKYFVKSKTVRKNKTEMAVEVFCKNNDMFFLEKVRDVGGVEDVTLIQYNGEYHG